ncbi:MAG TPA: hypothetical protein VMC03_00810 [Streptosporangiaceae bacterium]|nr:hypothetical protein [Streptosporangiaceae bacterium]
MSDTDLLADAAAELYSSDPDQFVERRGALAAAARAAGQAPVARQIAALRKPTRSAWVVNRLARAEPAVTQQLTSLGDELRAAQESLDGAAIRELSQRRHDLIEALARRAFEVAGQPQPSAALRDEVTTTLGAALADPAVAGQVASGTLIRPASTEGFGLGGLGALGGPPELTLVTASGARGPSRTPRAPRPGRAPTRERSRTRTPAQPAKPAQPAGPSRAEQARADRERRRQADLAAAERAAEEAARTAEAATAAEHDLERTVQTLEEQLADARRDLAETRNQARRARNRQRQISQALDRLRG